MKARPWLDIREIGGAMSPLWSRYYDNVNRIIFVIDTSNLCEIAGAGEFMDYPITSSNTYCK